MKILITAGNTQVPIDQVRVITNRFSGKTGALIAKAALDRGHEVILLTSSPEAGEAASRSGLEVVLFNTFADLQTLLEQQIRAEPDAVVHSAAVSDYQMSGVFAPRLDTRFDDTTGQWQGSATLVDRQAPKVKSDEPELWLRLVRAPKLVDCVRRDWGFRGLLVKFKLEAGVSEPELLRIAEASRRYSSADLMVANTLESAKEWAYLGPVSNGSYLKIQRPELPGRLISLVEEARENRSYG